ncbi:ABC transporter permease [Pengzhenrongella phosphoraccumulans]|uniref:ABC transporter permease n=1 Tax=Pengzhenrongella phosphoraccumulans TaxID=3114394 RepID=UPI00388D12D7
MTGFVTTVRHELLSSRRERLPQVLLVVFLAMVSVSAGIGWITNHTVTQVWEKTRAAGLTTAPNPFTDVSALYYARNTVIYIVMIGSLLAIVLGVSSVLRGRASHTVDLILSRPISTRTYLAARLTGMATWLAAVVAAAGAISWISLTIIGRHPLAWADSARLVGFLALAWAFVVAFVLLGMVSALYARRETTALLVPIVVWSVVTLVLPQLGTAAHPVSLLNPVPAIANQGGSFPLIQSIVGPLSISEQFKTASGILLRDDQITGNLTTSLLWILAAITVGIAVLLATRRDQVRKDLDE